MCRKGFLEIIEKKNPAEKLTQRVSAAPSGGLLSQVVVGIVCIIGRGTHESNFRTKSEDVNNILSVLGATTCSLESSTGKNVL